MKSIIRLPATRNAPRPDPRPIRIPPFVARRDCLEALGFRWRQCACQFRFATGEPCGECGGRLGRMVAPEGN